MYIAAARLSVAEKEKEATQALISGAAKANDAAAVATLSSKTIAG